MGDRGILSLRVMDGGIPQIKEPLKLGSPASSARRSVDYEGSLDGLKYVRPSFLRFHG